MSERVFIIGAGRVGRGLTRAFRSAGVNVVGLHARRAPRDDGHTHPESDVTSGGEYPPALGDANVIIIAVRDAEINGVCASLAAAARVPGRIAHGTVILHTSGAIDPPAYAQLRALGYAAGTFHPLVPFATPERGARLVRDGWVGIDGDATACAASRRLAAALNARTVNIPPNAKGAYHAAAVIASNFPVVLAGIASQVLARTGIPVRTAEQVVQRLMSGAVENLEYGSPAEVLTGPAVRGDTETMHTHARALRQDEIASVVYDILSRAAIALVAGKQRSSRTSADDVADT